MTLFETTEGYKGGIYTPLSWDSKSGKKNDLNTFMFNLNKRQKYKKIKSDNSTFCANTHGPWTSFFGFHQKNQMKKIEHNGSGINNYFDKGAEILPNNNSTAKLFDIKEVEIYKIIF